ncbi:MAG TPA: zf-HC2 domain-containing protein, partial [Bryobacteraceae bacterium]|nr:zf-HC2 domain-containing protein [Bryobacteraceae bacterium]
MEQEIHGTEQQLEAYALGQLSDSEEQVLEEHLLLCGACRTAVDQNLIFDSGMREALKQAAPARDWLAWLRPVFAPRFAMAGALAALVVVAGLYFATADHTHYSSVAALQLAAIRGTTPSVEPVRELDLTLNSFPTSGGPFKMEVVDANGGKIWSGATSSPSVAVHEKFRP